jgi:hypothetical protein
MSTLSDIFSQLKSTIVGTKTQDIDAKLDKASKDIISYRANSGRVGYIELVKKVIASSTVGSSFTSTSSGLFGSVTAGPAAFGQGMRLMRYKTYEAIVYNINYCFRALTVLVDNILAPDDITKNALDIRPKTFLEDEIPNSSRVKRVKEVIKLLKLEDKLDIIVRNTLQFGDFFCEICDAKSALTSRSLITESQKYIHNIQEDINNRDIEIITEKNGKEDPYKFYLDFTSLKEYSSGTPLGTSDGNIQVSTGDSLDKEKEQTKLLRNLNIVFHEGKQVIKLQSALFPVCFGYLVFPKIMGIGAQAVSLADEAINNICRQILRSVEDKIPQAKEFKNTDELKDIIKHMISRSEPNRALEIRFVPSDRMVHFRVPSARYYPYGESVFDSMQYTAKVLIALETALAIQRLSRSTEKRKIAIEMGLPRDAKKLIEGMKEEMRKRKVSLDSFGTVDTIPSMITTFEDVYIPQKDGKPFVDISTFDAGRVDVRSKVDELRFLRDQLVASLGVPPSFIGIEENLSAKATLSEENILFARTIIGHQKYLTHQINELIEKVYNIIDPEEALTILDNVMIAFPVPKSLQFEREARYMNEIAGLIESLERIGIPKEYSKKKYLANFDWDEINKYAIDQKVETAVDPTKAQTDQFGMGGMGGIGGMGGGGFTPTGGAPPMGGPSGF